MTDNNDMHDNDTTLAAEPAVGHVDLSFRKESEPARKPWIRCLMQVLWPAFLGAAMTVGLVFSLIDPLQVDWVHTHLNNSREAAYTGGFILFWMVYALACGMTWFLVTTETRTGTTHQ